MVKQAVANTEGGPGGDWREVYESRLTTHEEAVRVVKSGDTVVFSIFASRDLQSALFARGHELNNVTVRLIAPSFDPGWLRPGSEDAFSIEFELFIGDFARFVSDERRAAYLPNLFSLGMKAYDEARPDVKAPEVAMVVVSPPNKQGYCHFGAHHWVQRSYARRVQAVIAEVDPSLIKVYGDCYIHVSEIDHFVEAKPVTFTKEQFDEILKDVGAERRQAWERIWNVLPDPTRLAPLASIIAAMSPEDVLRFLGLMPPPEYARTVAGYLSELIQDGDTIQIGVGEPARFIPNLGAFDDREDLGLHTELGSPELGRLVQEGVITGRYKEIHREKAVATAR